MDFAKTGKLQPELHILISPLIKYIDRGMPLPDDYHDTLAEFNGYTVDYDVGKMGKQHVLRQLNLIESFLGEFPLNDLIAKGLHTESYPHLLKIYAIYGGGQIDTKIIHNGSILVINLSNLLFPMFIARADSDSAAALRRQLAEKLITSLHHVQLPAATHVAALGYNF